MEGCQPEEDIVSPPAKDPVLIGINKTKRNKPGQLAKKSQGILPKFLACARNPLKIENTKIIRVLGDGGAQVSLITAKLADCLGLSRRKTDICLEYGEGSKSETDSSMVTLMLQSTKRTDFKLFMTALVVPKIANTLQSADFHPLE